MNLSRIAFLRSPLILHSGIAALDQAILSAASFIVSVILIRTVPKAEYGYYSVALPVSLFLISLQNALVNTPLTVQLVSKPTYEKPSYVASLGYGQLLAVLPSVAVGLGAITLLNGLSILDRVQSSIAAAVCMACVGVLLREFLRSYLFAERLPLSVLKLDSLYVFIFLGLIALLHAAYRLGVAGIFLLMGASSLFIAVVFSRGQGWWHCKKSIRKSFAENWQYGKWALLGVIVTHVQNYSYLYLMGTLIGSISVADVSAARLLLMPLALVQTGWNKIALPHGSMLYEKNRMDQFFKEQLLASIVFVVGIAVYVTFLLTMPNMLMRLLLTEKYSSSPSYSIYWGIVFGVEFFALAASNGLQVARKFKSLSNVNILTMLITVSCAYFLIRSHGITGGLVSLIIGQASLALVLWYLFAKAVLSSRGSAEGVSSGVIAEVRQGTE